MTPLDNQQLNVASLIFARTFLPASSISQFFVIVKMVKIKSHENKVVLTRQIICLFIMRSRGGGGVHEEMWICTLVVSEAE